MGFWDTDSEGLDWYDLTVFGWYDTTTRYLSKTTPVPQGANTVDNGSGQTIDLTDPLHPVVTVTPAIAKPPGLLDRAKDTVDKAIDAEKAALASAEAMTRNVAIIAALIATVYVIAVIAPAVKR